MTRKEILLLAAVLAQEDDDIVSLAHEIADFLLVDEEEIKEEEPPQKPVAPSKIEDRVKGRMWNMPEEFNVPPREHPLEKAKKIMERIGKPVKDEFYIDPKKEPAGWSSQWITVPTGIKKPEKNKSPWTKEDLGKLDEMLKAGSSFAEIAINLKRSEKAVETVVQKLAAGYPVGRKADK